MRRRLLALAVVLALAAGVTGGYQLLRSKAPGAANRYHQPVTTDENRNATVAPTPSDARVAATAVSRAFAERFGSFTGERPGVNLLAAASYATAALQQTLQRQAEQLASNPTAALVTSRVITVVVRSIDERVGRADIGLTLLRTERSTTKPTVTYQQDLSLQLIREGEAWKVNQAIWGAQRR